MQRGDEGEETASAQGHRRWNAENGERRKEREDTSCFNGLLTSSRLSLKLRIG